MYYVSDNFGEMPMSSVRWSMEVLSVERLFLAYRFALWLRIMKI